MPMYGTEIDDETMPTRMSGHRAHRDEIEGLNVPPPPPSVGAEGTGSGLPWTLLAAFGLLCAVVLPPLGILISLVVRIRFGGSVGKEHDLADAGLLIGIAETVILLACIAAAWAVVGKMGEALYSLMAV